MGFRITRDGKKGEECVMTEEGLQCRRFEKVGDDDISTGSDVTMNVDPKSCKVLLSATSKIMDEDKDWVKEKAKNLEEQCKRGLV